MSIILTILCAFSSGAVGAMMGAMPSIIFMGFNAGISIISLILGSPFNWLSGIQLGMFLGPHVAFGPACAAACYARFKGYQPDSKNIFLPNISLDHPDIYIVGGIFGVMGWFLNELFTTLSSGRIDSISAAIVIVSMIARICFGNDGLTGLIGRVPEGKKRFDVRCSDCWLPYETAANGFKLLFLSAAAGCLVSNVAKTFCDLAVQTGNDAFYTTAPMPLWGIAISSYVFMPAGLNVPVWHHIAMCAGMAVRAAYQGGGSNESSILWGIAFGVAAAYAGDYLAKCFSVYGEGYVDPPSMAMLLMSVFLQWIFPAIGVTNPASVMYWVIPIGLLLFFAVLAYVHAGRVKAQKAA